MGKGSRANFDRLLRSAWEAQRRLVLEQMVANSEKAVQKKPSIRISMLRETKFGYGFLFVGTGLPFLIDKLFGITWAIVVSVACVIVGIAFLWAGHRRKEDTIQSPWTPWEYIASGAAIIVLIAVVSVAVLLAMPNTSIPMDQRASLIFAKLAPLEFDNNPIEISARVSAINGSYIVRIEPGAEVYMGIRVRPFPKGTHSTAYPVGDNEVDSFFHDHYADYGEGVAVTNAVGPHEDISVRIHSHIGNDLEAFSAKGLPMVKEELAVFVILDARFNDAHGKLRSEACSYFTPPDFTRSFVCYGHHNDTWPLK